MTWNVEIIKYVLVYRIPDLVCNSNMNFFQFWVFIIDSVPYSIYKRHMVIINSNH